MTIHINRIENVTVGPAIAAGITEGALGDVVGQGFSIGLTDKTLSDYSITSTLFSTMAGGMGTMSTFPIGTLKLSPFVYYPLRTTIESAWQYWKGWIAMETDQQLVVNNRLEALQTEIIIFQNYVNWASRRQTVPAPETNLDYQSTTITEPPTSIGPCTNDDKNEVEF